MTLTGHRTNEILQCLQPNITQWKFNFISSIICNNYRCAGAFGMILRIAVRTQTLGVGTPFPLVQKCLWELRSHTKYLWERRSHAFPHHYTPVCHPMHIHHCHSIFTRTPSRGRNYDTRHHTASPCVQAPQGQASLLRDAPIGLLR